MRVAFLGLTVFPCFSLLWPSPWGWEEQQARPCPQRGPAPSSGRAGLRRGRVGTWLGSTLRGIAAERLPAGG